MADYGLISKNINSEVQIDSTYINYVFWDSGSSLISEGLVTVNFTDTARTPIVGIRPSSANCCALEGINRDAAGNYTSMGIYGGLGDSGTIQWIIFINDLLEALPTYGLIVKNSSDEVVFSSAEKYFRIIGIYPGVQAGNNVTVVDADNNYFITYPFSMKITSDLIEPQLWITVKETKAMKKVSSTTINVSDCSVHMAETEADLTSSVSWHSEVTLMEVSI